MNSSNYPTSLASSSRRGNLRTVLMRVRILLIVTAVLFGICFSVSSGFAAEQMGRFDVAIQIGADGWVRVEETIQYEFPEGVPSRGIIRQIPVEYRIRKSFDELRMTEEETRRVRFELLKVQDERGVEIASEVRKQGEYQAIKIGSEDVVFYGGTSTYNISYRVKGVINEFDDHDEFYWNVTGEEWQIPIRSSNVEIQLPGSPDTNQLQVQCFTGIFRSIEKKCSIVGLSHGIVAGQITEALSPNEGFTVVVGFPKGLVAGPTWWEQNGQMILAILILLIPVGVLAWLIRHWHKHGRDPEGRSTIIAEYEPPDGMLPAEAGAVIDEKADIRDITATIVDFAVRGFLKFRKIETKTLGIFGKTDYELEKVADPLPGSLQEYERLIWVNLFVLAEKKVKLSSLKNSFYVHLPSIREALYTSVVKKGWFLESPDRIRKKYVGYGSALFFVGFGVGWVLSGVGSLLGTVATASLMVSGFMILLASRWMPKKTEKGAVARDWLAGFKDFVITTEHDRMLFHYAPEKSPKTFEKYLPYAMALKIEKQWAELFGDIAKQPPSWFEGNFANGFTLIAFSNIMGDFSKDLSSAIVSSPRGNASGGWSGASGFGGGGFSGGGFGGGGGGRW